MSSNNSRSAITILMFMGLYTYISVLTVVYFVSCTQKKKKPKVGLSMSCVACTLHVFYKAINMTFTKLLLEVNQPLFNLKPIALGRSTCNECLMKVTLAAF